MGDVAVFSGRPEEARSLGSRQPPFPWGRLLRQPDIDNLIAKPLPAMVENGCSEIFKFPAGAGGGLPVSDIGSAGWAGDVGKHLVAEERQKPPYAGGCLMRAAMPGCDVLGIDRQNIRYRDGGSVTTVLSLWPVLF
jgi:hypothetical protein